MKSGIELIAEERERQIRVEGYQDFQDDAHEDGELANAAVCYALDPRGGDAYTFIARTWPWRIEYLKIACNGNTNDNLPGRIKDLKRAGALIAAEIDRLQRLKP